MPAVSQRGAVSSHEPDERHTEGLLRFVPSCRVHRRVKCVHHSDRITRVLNRRGAVTHSLGRICVETSPSGDSGTRLRWESSPWGDGREGRGVNAGLYDREERYLCASSTFRYLL